MNFGQIQIAQGHYIKDGRCVLCHELEAKLEPGQCHGGMATITRLEAENAELHTWKKQVEEDGESPRNATIVRLEADNAALCLELAHQLEDSVRQACRTDKDGEYDSCAISTWADAMLRLAELGRFTVDIHHGRRVIGRFVEARGDQA